ncbi:MAG: hypothetical protein HZB21_01195, partial [Deltaproteobacteria bacterium]|nr:hypothetical protein [Deltaproteobacteria bacterium]
MERVFSSRWFHLITAVIIAVSVAAAYSNTLHSVFQFDDTPQIVDNVLIRDINNFTRILRSGRGVTMLTFALNYAVGGLNVAGYHIVNIAIHIVNAILAYFLLFNTFKLINGDEAWSK